MTRIFAAAAIALVTATIPLATAGCSRRGPLTCDEAALTATLEALEADSLVEGAEARAIDGLAAACPRLHPGFIVDLRLLYTPDRGGAFAYHGDSALNAARREVCGDPEAWVRDVPAAPPEETARVLWDACDFHRLGLLDEGERPLADDNLALFVFAWLERDGVDRALVRRLARGLMIAVAPAAAAGRRCAEGSEGACDRYLERLGLELPTSGGEGASLHGSLRLVLGVDGARWSGQELAAPTTPGDEASRLRSLAAAVQSWLARRSGDEVLSRLTIAVDRRLAHGAVLDALRVASNAGMGKFSLMARSPSGRLVAIPVETPPGWRPSADVARTPAPLAVIDGAIVRFSSFDDTLTTSVYDLAPLRAEAVTWSRLAHRTVRVRVTPETPVGVVITVLDALHGSECQGELGEGCLLSQLILDREPRFPARPGRWEALSLAIRGVTVEPGAPPWFAKAALRAELEPRLDDLARCLRDDETARLDMPTALMIFHARDHDRDVVFVGDSPRDPLPSCIPALLGPLEQVYEDRSTATVEIEVIVPAADAAK